MMNETEIKEALKNTETNLNIQNSEKKRLVEHLGMLEAETKQTLESINAVNGNVISLSSQVQTLKEVLADKQEPKKPEEKKEPKK